MQHDWAAGSASDIRNIAESRPFPGNIQELLAEAARRHGDKAAIVLADEGVSVTYTQLQEIVARAAAGLLRMGLKKGSHVALMLSNGLHYPVTWLACAKLGAVVVPLNNNYTPREIHYVLQDSQAAALILDADYLERLELVPPADMPPPEKIVVVGRYADGKYRAWGEVFDDNATTATEQGEEASLDDVINIQYTSGTTGFPKGCLLSHRYWLTLAISSDAQMNVSIERILCGQNFFYMIPHRLLLNAFLRGAALVVPRRITSERFMHYVRDWKIHYACVFEPVFKQPAHPEDGNNDLTLVHVFGLSARNQAAFEERFNVRTQEFYGMTEIGGALFMPLDHPNMIGSGSCGVPAPFRELRIVDDTGNNVSTGATGELWVRGPGMMHGYHNKPEATAEVFCDGWFRTGDLFRQDQSGYFYIVGRLKEMIRRSGENVSAREVEWVLRSLPEVLEVAVVPVPDDYHGEEVKAFIKLRNAPDENRLTAKKILNSCKHFLAPHKIPRYVQFCTELPMTETARVERKKLMAMHPDNHSAYDRKELERLT